MCRWGKKCRWGNRCRWSNTLQKKASKVCDHIEVESLAIESVRLFANIAMGKRIG